jgi:hypothetical protein
MDADQVGGYDFVFSAGMLKKQATVKFTFNIEDLAQDGWTFSTATADGDDLQLKFTQSTKKIKVTKPTPELELDADVLKTGSNTIYLEITKAGYIVSVNDKKLEKPGDPEGELALSKVLDKVYKINVSKLAGTATGLVVGSTRYE